MTMTTATAIRINPSPGAVSLRNRVSKIPVKPGLVPGNQVQELKEKLSRHGKTSDRKNVLNSMKDCAYLRSIPMKPAPSEPKNGKEWTRFEREVCCTSIEVNGISIGPGSHASSSMEVRRILTSLCGKLTEGLANMTSEELFRHLVIRLSDTNSKADTYSQLNAVLSCSCLTVQAPKAPASLPKTKITIYESGQHIHATCQQYHAYGLYRKSDAPGGKPWIKLTAALHERSNLSTGASVRTLELRLPHK